MDGSAEHIANIGGRGAARRRLGGYVWAAVAAVAFAALLLTGAPRSARLALFVPLLVAAAGFTQARAKT